MAQYIIRINGIERIIFDGETLRHIALLKLHAGAELVFFSQYLCVAHALGIYIESDYLAADTLREVYGVATRPASDFQHRGAR